jgi:gamma-glutamyltranspeptidase/glutathione hydrolase
MLRLWLLSLVTTLPLLGQSLPITSKGGMVVSVSPPATDVGIEILKKGGNAVDAAIAVGFAEAVTWPEAGNIGGGGFMLVCPPNGKNAKVFDYREMAPAAATKEMFAKGVSYQDIRTAGVPGTVRGFELAHKTFGKLPWKSLVEPAAKLADDGFTVTAGLARRMNMILRDKATKNEEFHRVYSKPDKTEWKAGDTMKLPDLANTLKAIAEKGPDAFYTGKLAELYADEMTRSGGIGTVDDLKNYKAVERVPMANTYRGYEILACPPPSSGGTALFTILNILENYDLGKHPWGSAETTHLVAEAQRRAYCDRAKYLGDPAFTEIPKHLATKEHAKKLASTIDLGKATRSETLAPELKIVGESENTTHYSVIDKDGMAVSNTYTLENAFGCRVVVRGAGYILNNEMTDFNGKPGVTTRLGGIGTEPNTIAPGKRMLSSMCPVIVLKDGKPVLVTGSPGGRTIINTVLTVVLNFIDYGADVQKAVDAPRMHHQWFPDQIATEDRAGLDEVIAALKVKGHTVVKRKQGDAHSISIDPKTGLRTAGVDHRLDGSGKGE